MNFKEALLSGATEDKLYEDFKAEIEKAKVEIEQEKKAKEEAAQKKEQLKEMRRVLAEGLVEYYYLLGMLDDADDETTIAMVENLLKNSETSVKFYSTRTPSFGTSLLGKSFFDKLSAML